MSFVTSCRFREYVRIEIGIGLAARTSGSILQSTSGITFMTSIQPAVGRLEIGTLLRGKADAIASWIASWTAGRSSQQVLVIVAGAGAFGAAMGCWRDPTQAVFAAIKLPLIVLATACSNALINGMLAPLLGLNLTMRQSFAAVLMSFGIAAAILGAASPLMAFLVWNLPPLQLGVRLTGAVHAEMLLTLVVVIAFAGITANLRLLQLLRQLSGQTATAQRILFAWLAVNLLLGSQLSWILRPFIGTS